MLHCLLCGRKNTSIVIDSRIPVRSSIIGETVLATTEESKQMKSSIFLLLILINHSQMSSGLIVKPSSSKVTSGKASTSANNRGNAVIQSSNVDTPSTTEKDNQNQLFNAITLVAGTTVGAGILALPAVAIESGFVPSSATLIGTWVFMVTTGMSRKLLSTYTLRIISIYEYGDEMFMYLRYHYAIGLGDGAQGSVAAKKECSSAHILYFINLIFKILFNTYSQFLIFSLSLCVSLSRTHTHTICLSLILSHCLSLSLYISFYLSHTSTVTIFLL